MPSNLLVAFCCNQHLFGVCHDSHRSARVSVSLAVSYHQSPGKAWPGEEGKCRFRGVREDETVWTCYQVFPPHASDDFTTRLSTISPDLQGPVITPSHQRHFCGHTRHTPLSHHVTCHEGLTSELGPGQARADRCPADSLTLPRLTSGVTSQRSPAGPGRGNLCSVQPSPLLHSPVRPGLCVAAPTK